VRGVAPPQAEEDGAPKRRSSDAGAEEDGVEPAVKLQQIVGGVSAL